MTTDDAPGAHLGENTLRCPKCSSYDCDCISTTTAHTHRCNSCGYELVAAPVRR